MAANRLEPLNADQAEKTPPEGASAAAVPKASSALKLWLPLVMNILLMPVLAYVTTVFLLVPKIKSAASPAATAGQSHAETSSSASHGEPSSSVPGKGKFTAPLGGKVLVNIAGTMGTRYLLANLTLVGPKANLKDLAEQNDAELRDVAASVLASKTIADLEKPGARNLIRSELISVFNSVLGDGSVTELYLTEFAIQ
jgi:flagellar FliL protein